MGLYVNPTDRNKEAWLANNLIGIPYTNVHADMWLNDYNFMREEGNVPVVFVDNGAFTALAVAYNYNEAADFAQNDGRSKIFTAVSRQSLADPKSGVGEQLLKSFGL